MQKFLHPQSIVRIISAVFPVTARRVVAPYMVWKYLICDDAVGWHRCTESNCHLVKNISPAPRPWVGSVARNTLAIQNSRKESNKTPTATPKPAPA